ncbi:MAG TPA: thioredoxin domain-containing protein, partial [Archangium sp.]|nr:thioredoxin domain-containing protein [Archangium sp.]
HQDVTFGKIDTDAQPELSGMFQIRSIPTLMIFRDGILLFEQAGALPAAALEELLTKVRELDMEEVRREIEKRKKEQEPRA